LLASNGHASSYGSQGDNDGDETDPSAHVILNTRIGRLPMKLTLYLLAVYAGGVHAQTTLYDITFVKRQCLDTSTPNGLATSQLFSSADAQGSTLGMSYNLLISLLLHLFSPRP
jgi:hypothetical protein